MNNGRLLSTQIARLRRQIRALSLARNLGWWLVATAATSAALIAVDYLLRLPAGVRIVLATAWVLLVAITIWSWVIRRAWQRVELSEVATAVDRRLTGSQDRITTGIELLSAPDSPLVGRVLTEAELRLTALRSRQLLRPYSAFGPLGAGLACTGLLLVLGMLAPGSAKTGLQRFLHPLGSTVWPRWVKIVPLSGDQTAASGDVVEVAMRLRRGDRAGRQAWVVREGGGQRSREPMRRHDDGRYAYEFQAVSAPFRYWFEAGDDSTAPAAGHVGVYRRPELVRARLRIQPPKYTSRPAYTIAMGERRAEALAGSEVTARFWMSDPIENASLKPVGQPATSAPAEDLPALRFAEGSQDRLEADIKLNASVAFRLDVRDIHGLSTADDRPFILTATVDGPPSIKRLQPASPLMLTPAGQVEIVLEARDDIGLASVKWLARNGNGQVISLDWSDALSPAPVNGGHTVQIRRSWSPAQLQPQPGEIISCWAEVTDNYELEGIRHPAVKSEALEIRIVGPDELAKQLETQAASLQSWLRQLLERQDRLQRRTATNVAASQPAETMRIAAEQRELASRLRELSVRYAQVQKNAAMNQLGASAAEMMARLEASRDEAATTADGPMHSAAEFARGGRLEESVREQRRAIEQLQRILNRWGDEATAQELARGAQQLLARQEELTQQTAQLPKADASPGQETAEADRNRLAHAQRELASDAERQLSRLSRSAGTSQPSAGESGRNPEARVTQEMREAADAVRAGNTEAAREAQQNAESALREILGKSNPDPKRRLAELSRKNSDAQARLRDLIAAQSKLITDIAGAAGNADALGEMRERQSILRARTRAAADLADKADPSGTAGGLVHGAAEDMSKATAALASADGPGAQGSAGSALDKLRKALAALTAAERQNQRQLAALAAQELRAKLAAIRAEQLRINQATAAWDARRSTAAQTAPAARAESRSASEAQASELGRAQATLAERIRVLQPQLAKVVVGAWVVMDLGERMSRIAKLLQQGSGGSSLGQQQKEVLSRLDMLLRSLALENGEEGYAEGKSGSNSTAEPRPVSRIGEIKLLRDLQADLLERTRQLHASGSADIAAADRLGHEQRQLRELAAGFLKEGQP